ncbi:MAG: hypothetical protein ACKV19_19560 [Verrucomicrobiales bacterium]
MAGIQGVVPTSLPRLSNGILHDALEALRMPATETTAIELRRHHDLFPPGSDPSQGIDLKPGAHSPATSVFRDVFRKDRLIDLLHVAPGTGVLVAKVERIGSRHRNAQPDPGIQRRQHVGRPATSGQADQGDIT